MADLTLSKQYLYNGVRYGPGPMSSDDEELIGALVACETNLTAENQQRESLREQYGPAVVGHDYVQRFDSLAPIGDETSELTSDEPEGEFDVDPDSPTFGQRVVVSDDGGEE